MVRGRLIAPVASLACTLIFLQACGGDTPSPAPAAAPASASVRAPASLEKTSYPVFPDPDAGADPSVPADQGGKGFTGQGWDTSANFDLIGDPRAVKGGVFREEQPNFPGTLRIFGPDANTLLNYMIQNLVY